MKLNRYKTEFVKAIPREIEDGILYVSIEYNIAIHRCACGCGSEVSTPISKKYGWILTYNGEFVSLHPSIGNGAYKCHSHYFLKDGSVIWLDPIDMMHTPIHRKIKWWEKLLKKQI